MHEFNNTYLSKYCNDLHIAEIEKDSVLALLKVASSYLNEPKFANNYLHGPKGVVRYEDALSLSYGAKGYEIMINN